MEFPEYSAFKKGELIGKLTTEITAILLPGGVLKAGSHLAKISAGTRISARVSGVIRQTIKKSGFNLPSKGKINLAGPRQSKHILYGDATGGGHKFGVKRFLNGKSKFPTYWSKKKIMQVVSEVVTDPKSKWIQQTGKPGSFFTKAGEHVKFKVEGVFENIKIRVIVQGEDIITAFPI